MTRYQSADIEVLSGLDPVRQRPGMYTDTDCPDHLAQEVIDNSIDEALSGHCRKLQVTLHEDGSLEVEDDGRGMPVDPHPTLKKPGVEVILTTLHSGAKFSDKNYQYAGGLHGVGISVVNALSLHLEIWVKREGREYNMSFKGGNVANKLEKIRTVGKQNTGTRLQFWPDPKYFDRTSFTPKRLRHLLRAKALLCPGLTVTLDLSDGKPESWQYTDGLTQYLIESLGGEVGLPNPPFAGHHEHEDEAVDWALCWVAQPTTTMTESYVNLVPTPAGGTHVGGLRTGLTQAIRAFSEARGLLPRGVRITPEDVWENLHYVLSYKTRDPQFAGQTKEKFVRRETVALLGNIMNDLLAAWLNRHVRQGEEITALIIEIAQRRQSQSRKIARKKATAGPALPGKLSDCSGGEGQGSELFLVEGDSAGGSAKQARDKSFQAILPLRGKILNTWELDADTAMGSQEVRDIAQALGITPEQDDLASLRYDRVCILADADSDGLHIATLLCALFLKHFPQLVKNGCVHMALPPLYRIDIGKQVHYALDDEERDSILAAHTKKNGAPPVILRFKGLGEMDASQLRESAMNPETRRLVRLELDDAKHTHELMNRLLGRKRAADRRVWLERHGHQAEV